MAKYEYIGKREILRRVSALGYPVASGKRAPMQNLRVWSGWNRQS